MHFNPIFIVLPLLTVLTYSLGLALKLEDFKLLVKKPLSMLVGLFAQIFVLPSVAFAIAFFANLPEVFFVGLVLIACCPSGSSSNIFTFVVKGDIALALSLTAIGSVITLFTLPSIMALCVNYTQSLGTGAVLQNKVTLPVGNLLIQNFVTLVLPVLLGIATKYFFKNVALKIERVLSKLALPSIIILATIYFLKNYSKIAEHLDKLGLSVLLLVLIAVAVSSLLSRIFRQSGKTRRTIVIEVAMQNAAQAIAIASSPFVFNSEIMTIPAIIYALFMNIVLLTYVAIVKRADKQLEFAKDQI
ncbi:MAG: bile acid:sodium symporter family protein [Aeromonadales bacterium]|nr:bile acid:sodium symporter family protein [Aeromonadales bacterium]